MRLLVVTARYPTPDRPSAGVFVRDRLGDADAVVVAPRRYDVPGIRRYAEVLLRALTTPGGFDGVEAHFVLPTGPIALLAARIRRLPLVLYAHGSDVRSQADRSALHRLLARAVLRGADAVVTNSADTAAHVRRLSGIEPHVIAPGVDLERFRPSPRPARRSVLYLGGDVGGKGVDLARRLADTLAGPGIRDVPPDEVPGLIAAHDVVLIPSREEGFGLLAAEAIASGRWVVASAVGGLRDVVTDGVDGSLVSDGDFAAALNAVPDYDPDQVAAGASRFSLAGHRTAMDGVWRRILERRRATGARRRSP
jgi:glycosyltransferase involved in cell wall biosynthesis